MKIWPLGVGGWIPAFNRQTNATLIEHKNKLIIIDAGTGLQYLSEYERLLNNYEDVDLILTHYHMDHIMGLFYLPKYLSEKTLTIWGPGRDIYNESCASILERNLAQPFGTTGVETLAGNVECKDYNISGFVLDDITIGIMKQEHTLPSFGITIDDVLHIATDTNVNKDVFDLNVKLLLHECWAEDDESAKEHSSLEAIVEAYNNVKADTTIQAIGLIHRNPRYSDTEYASWLRGSVFITQENHLIKI